MVQNGLNPLNVDKSIVQELGLSLVLKAIDFKLLNFGKKLTIYFEKMRRVEI
jgi:hypothetical protein